MIRFKLFIVAALGSLVSWLLIKTVLLEMSMLQFLAIEFIVGFSHYVYNDMKLRFTE
jgi:hypothetical protein